MELAQITPASDEHDRVLFVGTTGSGKTTLARVLLSSRAFVVVLDVKGTLNWPGYRMVRRLRDLARIDADKSRRIIYRPHYTELNAIDPFFRWILERGNTTLYVDELMYVG
jgi:DNA helicase HerA-like ATPase